jgi:argininosuccinate synthase
MSSRIIRSFADLDTLTQRVDHVLTLFSGGLDSSYVLKELARRHVQVTALSVDMGESCSRLELQEVAGIFGANLQVIDARDMFAYEAVAPAIRAQARYLGLFPVSASLARPILAKVAVKLARELGCGAIVHTANPSQNSLRRINSALEQLGYEGIYGTPYERSFLTRDEKIEALRKLGLTRFQARGISADANLWCREFESGSLDNPESFWVPPSLFEWTLARQDTPPSRELMIEFREGSPVAVDGQPMDLVPLIAFLNETVGAYQIGRYSGLEHLVGGEKVLEVREAPAATVLMEAYRHLETAVLDAELLREKIGQELLWTREAVEGRWFGPLRQCADAFIWQAAAKVSGCVTYQLRAGAMDLRSIKASEPLYITDREAWERSRLDLDGLPRLSPPQAIANEEAFA